MKKIIKSLDKDIGIINGNLYVNEKPEYDKGFLTFKNKIKNVNLEKINEIILYVLNHNKEPFYVGFAFYTNAKILEIYTTKKLKNIDSQSILKVQNEFKQYNAVESLLQPITFIDCEASEELKDYISVYDIVKIKEYLNASYNELKEFISSREEGIMREHAVENVKIYYNDFLFKKSNTLDINFVNVCNKTEENGKICIEPSNEYIDGRIGRFLFWGEIKYIIELIDEVREYVINNKTLKLKTVNFDGNLILRENGIILTDDKTFYVDKKHDSEIKGFTNYYKNFSFMEENLENILKNSFVKLSDCPKYISQEMEDGKPKSKQVKCRCHDMIWSPYWR